MRVHPELSELRKKISKQEHRLPSQKPQMKPEDLPPHLRSKYMPRAEESTDPAKTELSRTEPRFSSSLSLKEWPQGGKRPLDPTAQHMPGEASRPKSTNGAQQCQQRVTMAEFSGASGLGWQASNDKHFCHHTSPTPAYTPSDTGGAANKAYLQYPPTPPRLPYDLKATGGSP